MGAGEAEGVTTPASSDIAGLFAGLLFLTEIPAIAAASRAAAIAATMKRDFFFFERIGFPPLRISIAVTSSSAPHASASLIRRLTIFSSVV